MNETKDKDDAAQDQQKLVQWLKALHIPPSHATVGLANLWATHAHVQTLLIHKRLPETGWSDHEIQWFLYTLSTLDTNGKTPTCQQHQNTSGLSSSSSSFGSRWCGVGEREGRVYSSLVAQRHCGFAHGIGRSGDVSEPQPKAVGSSILAQLTLRLVLDAIRRGNNNTTTTTTTASGNNNPSSNSNKSNSGSLAKETAAAHGLLLPLCTGMSMTLILCSLREKEEALAATTTTQIPESNDTAAASWTEKTNVSPEQQTDTVRTRKRDIVLWSRIDQKSCFKAIAAAGLQCVVIPTMRVGDCVQTNMDAMREALQTTYQGRVLAIVTTTSCFAPRIPDAVDLVARLCQEHAGVHHIINHAYGLQCAKTCRLINRACVVGRVDAIVASLDKNFLVPVGGAIVLAPHPAILQNTGQIYAGRASASHIFDVCVTLLSMGRSGYAQLLQQRHAVRAHFVTQLAAVAARFGERVLDCHDANTISFAMTLDGLVRPRREPQHLEHDEQVNDTSADLTAACLTTATIVDETQEEYLKSIERDLTELGSMLFRRCVSGTRVVPRNVTSTIGHQVFVGFGSSCDDYPHAYLTVACAIGLDQSESDEFFQRLDKTLRDFIQRRTKKETTSPPQQHENDS